jgi:hypothetical protein
MVSPDERLVQRSGIETRPLAEGALLVDLNTGRCYRLNRVGAEIWSLLRAPLALPDICAKIASKYAPGTADLETDVRALVDHLATERLLEPVPLVPPVPSGTTA